MSVFVMELGFPCFSSILRPINILTGCIFDMDNAGYAPALPAGGEKANQNKDNESEKNENQHGLHPRPGRIGRIG